MEVKIGDTIFNTEDQPIMIILTEQDKKNIRDMDPEATKYAIFSKGESDEVISKFMEG